MDLFRTLSRVGAVVVSGLTVLTLVFSGPTTSVALAQGKNILDKTPGAPGLLTTVGEDLPRRINAAFENIQYELIGAGTMAFMNVMQTVLGQVAYDAANYIASGGKGESALFYKKGFEGYLQDIGNSALGEFIGSMSDSSFFHTIGFDLCRPPNPQALLRIQLSLGNFLPGTNGAFTRPAAKCDFNDVINNYDQVYQTLSNNDVLRNIDLNLNTSSNDLGVAFNIFGRSIEYVNHRQETAEKDRKEGQGWRTLSDIVSGNIRTPSDTIREEANQLLIKDPKATEAQINTAILQNAWEMGPTRLATYTASVFLNTLSSKLLNRIMRDGISLGDLENLFRPGQVNSTIRGADDLLEGNAMDTRKANIDLRTPELFKNAAFDLLSEMQGCPTGNRGAWNCVLDEGFAQAIQTHAEDGRFTIQEAIQRGYLHKDWKLLPSTSIREERDPLCYTYAYCSGNLRKLRNMRIIPVGVEFAANSARNIADCASSNGCATLGHVVSAFNDCNAAGQLDDAHPWCHLIDPDWVLTNLPQQCALSGYGDTMLSASLPQRREECQDVQTCLRRDDQGACVGGYGYCVAEKTVYRFGAQECSARYASCRSYASRAGDPVAYLRNTLDYGRCSQDNVGCLWYATERDATTARADAWIGTPTEGPRVYFDKTLESCPADQAGCTKLLTVADGQASLNLIANPSFETFTAGGINLTDWKPANAASVGGFVRPTDSVTVGNAFLDGQVGAILAGGYSSGYQQDLEVSPSRTHVFSFFVRRQTAGGENPTFSARFIQYRSDVPDPLTALDRATVERDYRSSECSILGGGAIGIGDDSGTLTSDWRQVDCTFATNVATRSMQLTVLGENVIFDAFSLTEGVAPTPFIAGTNRTLAATYMKVAPDDLNCQGADSDNPACAQYAKVCRQTEAGCDGYSDVLGAFPEVPAQVTANDACPASCVGYAEYRKLPSAFDLTKNDTEAWSDPADASSTYFIPSTAQACTQDAVGCEAFTSLASTAAGGESTAYFSNVRSCETPDENSQTYFTWEGSDTAGYQLRTWSLKKRTADRSGEPAPEGPLVPGSAGPLIGLTRSADLFGARDPLTCNEGAWRTRADSDCRQFYDAAGNVFYRYYSQTVLSTEECQSYRLTNTSQADCNKTGGQFRLDSQACVYQVYVPESRTCSQAAVGCRAYAGSEAGNVTTVFAATGTAGFVDGARVSNEALLVGDTSYRADVPAGRQGSIVADFDSDQAGLYRVSFWTKATAPASLVLRAIKQDDPSVSEVVGTVRLTGDWQQVTLGLFNGAKGSRGTTLSWTASAQNVSTAIAFFVDEIVVQQLQDLVFVNKDSWRTPNECDQSAYAIPQPQAMLGCRQYVKRDGATVSVRQFSRLCRQEAISCKAFIDTRNSEDSKAQTFVRTDEPPIAGFGAATTTRSADRYVYLIDDPSKHCDAENMSCRAFGKPVFSTDRNSIDLFETVYFKDDIGKYDQALCRPSEQFCEEFSTPGGKEYFKDPQTHACEYRENVQLDGAIIGVPAGRYSGWFQKGNDEPCYPNALASGSIFNLLRTGDRTSPLVYQGWAGTCPVEESECTEFRDPNDTSAGQATGRPYYFVKNERIDSSSCNGTVDLSRGCILLRDTTDARLSYNSYATYQSYKQNGAVAPVDCSNGSTNPACQESMRQRTTCSRTAPSCTLTSCIPSLQVCTPPTNVNDANMVVKVSLDRDCSQWLGCSGGETVYDPATNRYRDICTSLSLCDRASEQNGANSFCANYVNRASTSTEPILTAGSYFDEQAYANRPVGVGQKDYSGYSLPDAFQVADYQSVRVAIDGQIQTPKSSFANDYRLAAAVMMPPLVASGTTFVVINNHREEFPHEVRHVVRPTQSNQAVVIPSYDPIAQANGGRNNLCRHLGTGQIGFYDRSSLVNFSSEGKPVACYFAIRGGSDDYSFIRLANRFSALNTNGTDQILDQAYPEPLCRANPEADSPFSTATVAVWDRTKNPIQASKKQPGYENANACEYGEDCVCSYKRAEYEGMSGSKFYNVNSQAVPPGVCQGGPRDGLACLPQAIFELPGSASGSQASVSIAGASNSAQTCGPPGAGGTCVAFSKLEIVRGVFGNCLEQDTTRARGNIGQETFPCLTWNPTPVLFGERDPYHYVPTAGYFPPQNSGQYYCTSQAKTPTSRLLNEYDFSILPHGMSKLTYDDAYVSDGSGNINGGNLFGSYIEGSHPEGSNAANQCESADDDQDNNGPFEKDGQALRLVSTGRGTDSSYTEAFYQLNPVTMARWMYGLAPERASASIGASLLRTAMDETNFGYIQITPFTNPNGNGRLACGYQEDWVDGVTVDDYDDVDKTAPADRAWHEAFNAAPDYQPSLTRGSEELLIGSSKPLVSDCVRLIGTPSDTGSDAGEEPVDSKCYFKTWKSTYRSTDKETFKAITDSRGFNSLRDTPYFEQCQSDKPYYAIKAVFQTPAARSVQGFDPATVTMANARDIKGPWRLVGFWVSSCAGKETNDNRFIYMNVRMQKADICHELAEVRSKDSNQDAAFTDRVWSQSGYSVPQLGIQYGQSFAPFSSALNTKPAGLDPLYQTGAKLAGFSALSPSAFLASGYRTYFSSAMESPNQKWAYLTNLFARIYRVYHYSEQRIGPEDRTCVSGFNKGKKCVPDVTEVGTTPEAGHSQDCRPLSVTGACDTTVPPTSLPHTLLCNSLSGINAGNACGSDVNECHLFARIPSTSGSRGTPLQTSCNAQTGWTQGEDDQHWINGGTTYTRQEAYGRGAFRCAAGAIRKAGAELDPVGGRDAGTIYCSAPTTGPSVECPLEVIGHCNKPDGAAVDVPGTCSVSWMGSGEPRPAPAASACFVDDDCSFNERHFWIDRDWTPGFNPATITLPAGALPSPSGVALGRDTGKGAPVFVTTPSAGFSFSRLRLGNAGAASIGRLLRRFWLGAVFSGSGFDNGDVMALGTTSPATDTAPADEHAIDLSRRRYPGAKKLALDANGVVLSAETLGSQSAYVVGACQPLNELVPPLVALGRGLEAGICSEGPRAGKACFKAGPVTVTGIPDDEGSGTHSITVPSDFRAWENDGTNCGTITTRAEDDQCEPVSRAGARGSTIPTDRCLQPGVTAATAVTALTYWETDHPTPEAERNMNNDNNTCTTEAGYVPMQELCPDVGNEYCGLIAYKISGSDRDRSLNPDSPNVLAPTDVTLGHYTPTYLGSASIRPFDYIDYYTPRPPRIAAPDTQHCNASGSCPVQSLDRFTFNGVTEGIQNVAGGQQRSTIRFYGWAAHNQMALRRLTVDWGDATVQDFTDAKLKNHKPFCAVQKECFSPADGFTGLTCQSDNDCPLSAQACREMGTCRDKQNIECGQDSDCRRDGSQDACKIRSFFGNSADACEASDFQFAHVYTCNAQSKNVLPLCSGQNALTVAGVSAPVTQTLPAGVIDPDGSVPGTCYYGSQDSFLVSSVFESRPTCTTVGTAGRTQCENALRSASAGVTLPAGIQCGRGPATATAGAPTTYTLAPTQGRCSRDTTRFCTTNAQCAAGDRCITAGLAPPGGCFDLVANTCRFTPRVFLEDNWGWCTGECRTQQVGDTLQDNRSTAVVLHPYGGCYSGRPLGGGQNDVVRANTDSGPVSSLFPRDSSDECLISHPDGGFTGTPSTATPAATRNNRPWIVYPGSLQLRSR